MKNSRIIVITQLALLSFAISACSPEAVTGTTSTADVSDSDTPEMQTCRMAAQSMIDLARQAVDEPSSRPERREARRVLMEGWVARLASGENPCDVYADIGQASTTF
ncbi:MAG: hypothetical protein MI746_08490 [Pseudomonadales bacterium]|nr:hypothetical protein [Pseudomonadales bacterium]